MVNPMLPAVLKALGIGITFYTILIHCFVYWNWETPVKGNTTIPWYESAEHMADRKRLEDLLETLDQKVKETQNLEAKAIKLSKQARKMPKEVELFANHNGRGNAARFKALMEVEDLSKSFETDLELKHAFRKAIEELKYLKTAEDTDWETLARLEVKIPPRNERIFIPPCDFITVSQFEAKLLDLRKRIFGEIDAVREAIEDGDDQFLPVLLSSTEERLLTLRQEMIDSIEDAYMKEPIAQVEVENGDCVSPEEATEWLEAGIDAFYRGKDERQAILRAMVSSGRDVSSVILDANIPDETREPTPQLTNMRQLVDGPLVTEVAGLINKGIDLVGGYIDPLDQWLDEKAKTNPDLGKAAVATFMRQMGEIGIPSLPEPVRKVLKR